ncbi:dTDP-4-dehydrorhamnose reductase family protein [Deinococcus xianganensis]|uniref:dTDP-4-dehydrorhamnose reductase n=1 Tax=Deinococcus xianganensis TaxID=1507289 RepID=A0A6I4YD02_9DEIO|nr:SDR family oxidoreductase [Deinococcus xianganensis]MXV18260.1 sugar nucleotide-binding protein [Deinococcus xianganensis]
MKILILGGDGMFGHQFYRQMRDRHDVRVTVRQDFSAYASYGLFDPQRTYTGIDVRSSDRLTEVMADFRPDAVINAVGIVKQRHTAKESIPSLEINALLPHRLTELTRLCGARLVHLSTDCVFSGRRGMYQEMDFPDAEDLYGRSKFLGEVADGHALTLRTSIIGPELSRKTSLLEWVLAQQGQVRGFQKAIFSGLTTLELSRVIEKLLLEYPGASGLYQVSSEPIDKYELLMLIREAYRLPLDIQPDDQLAIDRSLDSSRFRQEFNYQPPAWAAMIGEMAEQRRADERHSPLVAGQGQAP